MDQAIASSGDEDPGLSEIGLYARAWVREVFLKNSRWCVTSLVSKRCVVHLSSHRDIRSWENQGPSIFATLLRLLKKLIIITSNYVIMKIVLSCMCRFTKLCWKNFESIQRCMDTPVICLIMKLQSQLLFASNSQFL